MNRHAQALPGFPSKEIEYTSHVPRQKLRFANFQTPVWLMGHRDITFLLLVLLAYGRGLD